MAFWLHHVTILDCEIAKWQFLNFPAFLTPLSYNSQIRFNPLTGDVQQADIFTNEVNGLPGVTVREWFWLGFGEQCSLTDQVVRLLLNKAKGVANPIPTAVKRMPDYIKQKYYPYYQNLSNFNGFSDFHEEVGECNPRCLPIVKPTFAKESEQGRRQINIHFYDNGYDLGTAFLLAEKIFYDLWRDMNRVGYCSPYVTTY